MLVFNASYIGQINLEWDIVFHFTNKYIDIKYIYIYFYFTKLNKFVYWKKKSQNEDFFFFGNNNTIDK